MYCLKMGMIFIVTINIIQKKDPTTYQAVESFNIVIIQYDISAEQ
jgi:hypothetical protein